MSKQPKHKDENTVPADNQKLHAMQLAVQSLAAAARHMATAGMVQSAALVRDMAHDLAGKHRTEQRRAAGVLLRQADARLNGVVFMPDDAGGDAPPAQENRPAPAGEIFARGVGVPAPATNPPPASSIQGVSKKNRTASGGTETKEKD